jgi:protein-tyrosine-phosphatase
MLRTTRVRTGRKEAEMTTELSPAEEAELKHRIAREAESLYDEFKGIFSPETINRYVDESFAAFRNRPRVVDFVPVFVRRWSRERLRALGQAEGSIAKERPEVLFVCVHNSGRSQMAAVLTAHLSEGRVSVRSAGSDPAERINPAVITVMEEMGLDMSQEFPKPLSDEVVRAADVVITMGCGDACPIYPGKRYEDWELDDPAGQDPDTVRRIREEIRTRVERLLSELGVASA